LTANAEMYDSLYVIAADTFLQTPAYKDFALFRKEKERMKNGEDVDIAGFVKLNPEYYHTYVLAGDYKFEREEYGEALQLYNTALTKEIATKDEEIHIKKQIELCVAKSK
jgi:isopenicillin-N N-acyltransferase like protein